MMLWQNGAKIEKRGSNSESIWKVDLTERQESKIGIEWSGSVLLRQGTLLKKCHLNLKGKETREFSQSRLPVIYSFGNSSFPFEYAHCFLKLTLIRFVIARIVSQVLLSSLPYPLSALIPVRK